MKLQLTKPIIFFDLETTGVSIAKDHIVEISYVKIYPNGDEESKTRRINPGVHIPEESSAVHHITDEDVKDCPTFKQVAQEVAQEIDGCDIAGYNSTQFDVPMLAEEFYRAEVKVDLHERKFINVQNIFWKKEPRTLTAAYKFYCHADLEGAHGANADAQATYDVMKAQLDHYPDLENNVDFLSEYSTFAHRADFAGLMVYNDKNEIIFNFGKHKGKRVCDVLKQEPSYYGWVMSRDFTHDTKEVLTNIKNSMK